MSWKSNLRQNWKGGSGGALLAVALGLSFLLLNLRLGDELIHQSYDSLFRQRGFIKTTEVALVYLDEASHRDLDQPFDRPWDRSLYARLVDRLTAEHAKAVTFDILFSGTNFDHLDGDKEFARAIQANGKVVLGAEYTIAPGGLGSCNPAIPAFFDVQAGWGFVQLTPDQDFEVRKHFHVPNRVDDSYSSLAWTIAQLVGAPFTKDPERRFDERWMNYYGPPGFLPHVSFEAALEPSGDCPAGYFSNKVVIVGQNLKTYYSGQRKDELRSPYSENGFGPAVDVQATQILNLMRHDWITRPPAWIEIGAIILGGVIFGYGLSTFRPAPACGVAVAGALLVDLIARTLFVHERIWFPWLIIVAVQIPLSLFWSVVLNSVQLYVQNRLFQQSLQMYLSPKLVKKFASEKDILKPGAKKQLLTILFSDIASFTSISEGMDSDDLAHEMNKYFQSAVSGCIHATDGTIVKYIGDAIFAFWNAPEGQSDHAMQGCEAALKFRDQPPQYVNGHLLVTRIGLHTGVANVGNFGSTARVDYTALGESINLASRMEGLNKYLGTIVLITSDTQAGVAGRLITRFLGNFKLKGFEKAVGVHELVGQPDQAAATAALQTAFADALRIFRSGDFPAARAAFQRVLEISPKDGPAKFYLKFIDEIHEHPLPAGWEGEVELKEK